MEFTLHTDPLRECAKFVGGAVKKKDDPVWGFVGVKASSAGVEFSVGNVDLMARKITTAAQVESDGYCAVSVDKFLSISKSVTDGMVEFKASDTVLQISKGRSKFKLPLLGGDRKVPFEDTPTEIGSFARAPFLKALAGVKSIVDNDYFPFAQVSGGVLMATNNIQAALVYVEHGKEHQQFHVMARAVGEVSSAFANDEAEVIEASCSDSWLCLQTSTSAYWSRFLGSTMPNVATYWEKEKEAKFSTDAELFLESLKRVQAVVGNGAHVTIKLKDNSASLYGIDMTSSEAWDSFECVHEGPEYQGRFVIDNLMSGLKMFKGEHVDIEAGKSILFVSGGNSRLAIAGVA